MDLRLRLRHQNWPLLIGAVLVGFMILVALFGPALAPQNPMQENFTLAVDGQIRTPPYPPFSIPGYPLGTDRWGRDIWSRILWGVRPTLIMVTTVAAFRLVVGIIVGLLIGWAEGRRARRLDSLLSSLLSAPVLIVAMIGIYAIGVDKGLWAFIFGLGLTGWAETARMVSEQTRLIKRQTFVEAARALGAGERLILFNHILRQIMSLVWVLLAFEISGTLLVAAELGFLGIYIGGGVWIEVFDFQSVNVAGLPELGEMLSSALIRIADPTNLVIIGSFIFTGILGFNLLGEGLRVELSEKEFGRRAGLMPQQFQEWLEARVVVPFREWFERHERRVIFGALLAVVAIGGWLYYQRNSYLFADAGVTLNVPGDHLWSTALHDPYGTLYVPFSLEEEPQPTWQAAIPGGPSGGPVVYADGTVVIAGRDNALLAFDPQGQLLWQVELDAEPFGSPALDAQGRVFVADFEGHITAFDAQGNRLWRVEASATRQATSGPVVGANGMIYVTLIDAVAAVSPEGVLIWRRTATDKYVEVPPRLNANESLVYLNEVAIDAVTGQIQQIPIIPEAQTLFTEPAFFTGADGRNYYRNGHEVIRWISNEEGLQVEPARTWEYGSFVLFNPAYQGLTPNQLAWLFYSTDYSDGRMVWIDPQGRLVGNYQLSYTNTYLVALGGRSEAYLCASTGARVQCVMAVPGVPEPQWNIYLEDAARPIGGALVPGAMYIATFDAFSETGTLYALSPGTGETQP